MILMKLRTTRLTLLPATADHVRAELAGEGAFGALLNAAVPASWPPGEYDPPAQRYFLKCLTAAGDEGVEWYGWYALRIPDSEAPQTVVAAGGFFGPPTREGVVEIGYSVCTEWRARGYGTEMTQALAAYGAVQTGVTKVIAHTAAENLASVTVLERSGFVIAGPGADAGTLRFEYGPAEK